MSSDYARPDAELSTDGEVILRVVNKRIPDSDEAARMVIEETSIFQPGSNLHEILKEDPDIDFSLYEDEEISLAATNSNCTAIEQTICVLHYLDDGDVLTQCWFYLGPCSGNTFPPFLPEPDPDPLPPGGDNGGEGGGGTNPDPNDPSGDDADACNPQQIMLPPHCEEEDDDDDDEEEEVEPCETDNEIEDSPDIQTGFATIWENSNAEADISERLEDGGWIIQTENGYEFQRFPAGWARTACGIDIPFNPVTMTLPDNVVGTVHTHPYNEGDDIADICIGEGEEYIYGGHASIADIQTQAQWASNATSNNFISNPAQFTTIVIDKDGIRITDGSLGFLGSEVSEAEIEENTTSFEPCGYLTNN